MLSLHLNSACFRTPLYRRQCSLLKNIKGYTTYKRTVSLWGSTTASITSFCKDTRRLRMLLLSVFFDFERGTLEYDIYLLINQRMLAFLSVMIADMVYAKSILWLKCIEIHFLWVL